MKPLHGSHITESMKDLVRHLPPKEAADLIIRAYDEAARKRFIAQVTSVLVALVVAVAPWVVLAILVLQ